MPCVGRICSLLVGIVYNQGNLRGLRPVLDGHGPKSAEGTIPSVVYVSFFVGHISFSSFREVIR